MSKTFSAALTIALAFSSFARGDDAADAKAVLEAAIKAHGGEAALGKFVATSCWASGTSFDGDEKTPMRLQQFNQGFDKSRVVFYSGPFQKDRIEVVNGKQGWDKDRSEDTEEMSADDLEYSQGMNYLNWSMMLAPLRAKEFSFTLAEPIKVADRPAVGIVVKHDKHSPLTIYFDKETHLLVKHERQTKNTDGKEVKEECFYSDLRTVQEMKQPYKTVSYLDGKKSSEAELTELKYYEKPLDDKVFAKP